MGSSSYDPPRILCKVSCLRFDPFPKTLSMQRAILSLEAAMPCLRAQRDALEKVEAQEVGEAAWKRSCRLCKVVFFLRLSLGFEKQ